MRGGKRGERAFQQGRDIEPFEALAFLPIDETGEGGRVRVGKGGQ